jgi:hypothetical protein
MPLRAAHLALNSSMTYIGRRSGQGLMMALDILVKNVALPGKDGPCDVGVTHGCFLSVHLADARPETRPDFNFPVVPAV